MERERESGQVRAKADDQRPGRGWTERFTGPIRYRRYTDTDAGGRPYIFFKIEQPTGQNELAQAVYEVLHQLKHLNRSTPGHGTNQPTGLQFNRDRKHGRVWKLPDTPTGRMAADIIDAKLSDLAHTLEQEPGRGR